MLRELTAAHGRPSVRFGQSVGGGGGKGGCRGGARVPLVSHSPAAGGARLSCCVTLVVEFLYILFFNSKTTRSRSSGLCLAKRVS